MIGRLVFRRSEVRCPLDRIFELVEWAKADIAVKRLRAIGLPLNEGLAHSLTRIVARRVPDRIQPRPAIVPAGV